jgi:hypothetical protein
MVSLASLFGHKMLCPDGHKIMPVEVDCQDFEVNLYKAFFLLFTIVYRISYKNYFKKIEKNMALL